ncbi:alpha-hydroxy-acid oxidizing protein [Actinomadura madurae]|uniref:L-lactate dehydrogenase (Cytochrome) n=1 Tax=Actinomadura madurae TaxID=1993 RepID=A0A1I5NK83_9ACTN|nr:alpha-hydroxy acid oxidase [Actinomadura madurae]SFP21746.1 L-lactate dehydrogenase (cytochrome) [Actinomadura madurae]
MGLERLINLADIERAARRRLPRPIFDIIAGGAGDEVSLRANQVAYERIRLRPRALVDVSRRDVATTVLGKPVSMPVLLDPAGYQRMASSEAELAVARAAGAMGTGFALSTVSSYPLETVAQLATGPKWFQLYLPPGDASETAELVDRAAAAGYDALCLTVDTTMRALRERDVRNRFSLPLKMTPRLLAAGAVRPRWSLDFLRGSVGRGTAAGFSQKMLSIKAAGSALSSTMRPVTEADFKLVRERWSGPLVIKGILRGDEAARMIEMGADGVVVSNHGGRQLDGVPATIEALPEIVDAVGDRGEVFIDGGVRRGTDVVKALAIGARAVLVGRPYVYGLAIGGEAGVRRVLQILHDETENAMGLLGCRSIDELSRDCVRVPREW